MSIAENKAVMRRFLEEVCNKQNTEVMNELIHPDCVFHGTSGDIKGIDNLKKSMSALVAAFPDNHFTLEDMVAEGDRVVSRYTSEGTHSGDFMGIPPTGNKFNITGISIDRIVNGKIAEVRDILDQLSMLQQLGVIPPVGRGK